MQIEITNMNNRFRRVMEYQPHQLEMRIEGNQLIGIRTRTEYRYDRDLGKTVWKDFVIEDKIANLPGYEKQGFKEEKVKGWRLEPSTDKLTITI